MDIEELKKIVREAGIVGAGGAGFPTYMKLDKRINTIILNCAECEPLLKLHRQLLEVKGVEIIKTLEKLGEILEASEIIIAVKEAYTSTIESLNYCLQLFENSKVRISLLPEIYPVGDELITIYKATGKIIPPGSIPAEIGIGVFNVETIYNIYNALSNNKPVTHKLVTVNGEVKVPKTIYAPIGVTIKEVIKECGGVSTENPYYINGGPITGNIVGEMSRITKTTNGIIVLPQNHPVILKKTSNITIDMKRAMSVCCQCNMCTDMCPRNLLGHPIDPSKFMKLATSGITREIQPYINTYFCSQCGVCEVYACNQGLSPRKLIGEYKNNLKINNVKPPQGLKTNPTNPMMEYREVPMKRIIMKLGLNSYAKSAPIYWNTKALNSTSQVIIETNKHIGEPSTPIVKKGQEVKVGDVIAIGRNESLSVFYHASVNGIIIEIDNKFVIINSMG